MDGSRHRCSRCRVAVRSSLAVGQVIFQSAPARELVTQGLYPKIRNPIYVFSALMLTGILIALQRPYALFFLLLVLIPVQIVRARKEAKVLEAKFGEEYRACRAKTWF